MNVGFNIFGVGKGFYIKKVILFSGLIAVFFSGVKAQNLVPNGSFEDHSGCPEGITGLIDQVNLAVPWFNPIPFFSTPDYYDSCNHTNARVPYNYSGYQPARTGSAYAGIIIADRNRFHDEYREYLEVPLSRPLDSGATYLFEMYVNLANNAIYSSSALGAYFSDTMIKFKRSYIITYKPQLTFYSFPQDTENWQKMAGIFTARGGERFLIIGNFNKYFTTQTTLANRSGRDSLAYYYVDDVSLEPYTLHGNKRIVKVNPNPFSDHLNIEIVEPDLAEEGNGYDFVLYDMSLRLVIRKHIKSSYILYMEEYAAGPYFYELLNKNEVVSRGKIFRQ